MDAVERACRRFSAGGEIRHARTHHARAILWCARGACVRGAFCRDGAAKRTHERIVAQRLSKRCAMM
eukprot:1276525-Lingulodinium_polyedra.AAC.1